jgi:hypothetical protein
MLQRPKATAISRTRIEDLRIKTFVEGRYAMAESYSFLRTRSTEEEQSEHRRTQDEKKTKTAMTPAAMQRGQALVLLAWQEVDSTNGFAFNR